MYVCMGTQKGPRKGLERRRGDLLALKNDPTLQSYCGDSLLVDVGLGFDHLRKKRLTGTRE